MTFDETLQELRGVQQARGIIERRLLSSKVDSYSLPGLRLLCRVREHLENQVADLIWQLLRGAGLG